MIFVKCNHIAEEKIVDYVLGNLSRFEYFKINSHIKHCPKCYLHVQSWHDTLMTETGKPLSTPSKQSVYNTFFQKQRLKRQRLTAILTSLSLFVILTVLFFSHQHNKLPSQIDLANEKEQQYNQQETYVKTYDEKDLTNLFLQTSLQSDSDEMNYLKMKNKATLPIESSLIRQSASPEQIIVLDDKICSIDWSKMEIICFKYILNKKQRIIPFETERIKISND